MSLIIASQMEPDFNRSLARHPSAPVFGGDRQQAHLKRAFGQRGDGCVGRQAIGEAEGSLAVDSDHADQSRLVFSQEIAILGIKLVDMLAAAVGAVLAELLNENPMIQGVNRGPIGAGFGLAHREGAAAKRSEGELGLRLAVLRRHGDAAYGARAVSAGSYP